MKILDKLITLVEDSISEDTNNMLHSWGIIKSGYSELVDSYRTTISTTHEWVSEYQERIQKETNISRLKIKYSHNSGYYIEVSNNYINDIPGYFIFKQSLTNTSKYTTEELLGFEKTLTQAQNSLNETEYTIFLDICNSIDSHFNNLYICSQQISEIDFYHSAALSSHNNWYSSPNFWKRNIVEILSWRHPVIEKIESDFISNSLLLNKSSRAHVITGPNMWGKSTFLRQNALIILMAHMWIDVPAKWAEMKIIDRIFSRVGSWDNLYLWQSTFMVEMQEISYILRHATNDSFIIIDEIGRGTSTYDGMSLAWGILQYIHEVLWSYVLFATHYHEIIDHVNTLKWCDNFSVAVWENEKNLVFLRKIIPGWIKKSYGIEVAKISWLPWEVLTIAKNNLKTLEDTDNPRQLNIWCLEPHIGIANIDSQENKYENIIDSIRQKNLDTISPLDALYFLNEIKKQVKNKK